MVKQPNVDGQQNVDKQPNVDGQPKVEEQTPRKIADTISDFDIEFFDKLGIPNEAIQEMREFIPYSEYGEMINKLKRLQDN